MMTVVKFSTARFESNLETPQLMCFAVLFCSERDHEQHSGLRAGGGSTTGVWWVEGTALLELSAGVQRGLRVPVVLQHCTVIESEPLILIDQLAAMSEGGLLSLMGENTVLGIAANCPLIGFQGAGLPVQWSQHIEIAAQGLIVRPESMIVGHRSQEGEEWISLPLKNIRVDGLLSGQFRIETSSENEASISGPTIIIDDLPVRGAAGMPGYAAERF